MYWEGYNRTCGYLYLKFCGVRKVLLYFPCFRHGVVSVSLVLQEVYWTALVIIYLVVPFIVSKWRVVVSVIVGLCILIVAVPCGPKEITVVSRIKFLIIKEFISKTLLTIWILLAEILLVSVPKITLVGLNSVLSKRCENWLCSLLFYIAWF